MIKTDQKKAAPEETQRCKVEKAFFVKGDPVEVGKSIDLPLGLALELKACNKVKFISAKTATEPTPGKTTN